MTAHDRLLDPPDDEDAPPAGADEPDNDLDFYSDGDWGSDERDRLLESTYDR